MLISRRAFGVVTGSAVASLFVETACHAGTPFDGPDGRLTARSRDGVKTSVRGRTRLELGGSRDATLQVPPDTDGRPLPLLVLLHGAGGSGDGVLRRLGSVPDEEKVAVLSPDSRGDTWDAIRSGFGPDVAFLDRALERVFATVAVDSARLAIGGFSDGATYALSLGLINGDLFPRIAAFSPGFVVEGGTAGKPRIFISHGTADPILPIDRCSRQIVPALRRRGYDVTFREFDGGHTVPPDIAREALGWITGEGEKGRR
jgi:phospholipase/carboxylesterase